MDSRLQTLENLGAELRALALQDELLAQTSAKNAWFTPEFSRTALLAWAEALRPEALTTWASTYGSSPAASPKTVGVLCAGNLPLVGLHDLLMGYLAGWKVVFKVSSDDSVLLPAVVEELLKLDPQASIVPVERLTHIDALLATGSTNTLRYFAHYFAQVPHVLRGSRTSVAVLNGAETEADLDALAADIFQYFGRGCRSITHLFLPETFDVQRLFASWLPWGHLAQHAKYGSNYDYHRALFMLNKEPFLENNFVLLREHPALKPPVGVIHYTRYAELSEVEARLAQEADHIQVQLGTDRTLSFGHGQTPELWDFADGIDTYTFLKENA
jgi:hypothetical protein